MLWIHMSTEVLGHAIEDCRLQHEKSRPGRALSVRSRVDGTAHVVKVAADAEWLDRQGWKGGVEAAYNESGYWKIRQDLEGPEWNAADDDPPIMVGSP